VEYIWKNNQREETTSKARNGDVTSEETLLIDEDEGQGWKMFIINLEAAIPSCLLTKYNF